MRSGIGACLLVTLLALALRVPGWPVDGVASGRAIAAMALGAAATPLSYALLRLAGPERAIAAAWLVATSPWLVQAARGAGAPVLASGGELAVAALCEVGVAPIVLALIALLRPAMRSRHLLVLAATAAAAFLARRSGHVLTVAVAGGTWIASDELGRWLAAVPGPRLRAAVLAIALVPALPSLASEHLGGSRFDIESLREPLERARRSGEPLYASDPALAARELRVDARPLSDALAPGALPPAAGSAFVLLLIDRGRILGGDGLPGDFESALALVARSEGRRLDARVREARLYRCEAPR